MKIKTKAPIELRKDDHINLAVLSQSSVPDRDMRFFYEPLFSGIDSLTLSPIKFLGRVLRAPIWISSMTGGSDLAHKININLAHACHEFGLGMGLGSCRILLEDSQHLPDFDLRDIIGNHLPFFANLGIAQIEKALNKNHLDPIKELVSTLRADGIIIHINPLQEWLQPEGDRFQKPPLETIQTFLKEIKFPVIVKEVGQGMGPNSLKALLKLPLAAVEFAAYGGTNFSKLELLRSRKKSQEAFAGWDHIGHSAEEMVEMANKISQELGPALKCHQVIISGGIDNFFTGFHLIEKIKIPALYCQASQLLKHAQDSYESLRDYIQHQIQGLQLARALLKIKT